MKKNILIVEDDLGLSAAISFRLKSEGFDFEIANDGVEALEWLKKKDFSLIILDIMLPNMDGISFGSILRVDREHKSIPVIVLTALDDTETRQKMKDIGTEMYMVKPYDPKELIMAVTSLVKKNKGKDDEFDNK